MKKVLLLLALFAVGASFAAEAPVAPVYENYPTSYFQIGIWYKFPRSQMESNVIGIKSGWPMCAGQGKVIGLEASWLGSLTQHIQGAQLGWTVCYSHEVEGLQATLLTCICRDEFIGAQLAPVFTMNGNMRGLQASCVNVSTGKFTGFQPAAIINISNDVVGFQAAPVLNVANDVDGLQASLLNVGNKSGFQLGLLNFAKKGFQFGFLNFMEDGFLPCFPIVNFSID
ncbi:MAG: hypothetical protein MJ033_06655 [Victivallaceae bacterium]|nr:hypothetical protein [Victivallaceae bacterium]